KYQEQHQVLRKGLTSLEVPFGDNLLDTLVLNPTLRKSVIHLIKLYNLKLVIELETHELKFTRFFGDDTFINVPFYLFADTLKRLIFFQSAIQTNSQSIILFEEPEAHCFEPYILETTNAIKNDINENQFFIVTHSSFVVQELLRDQDTRKDVGVFLVGANEQMETEVKRLDDEHLYDIQTSGVDIFFNFNSIWNETALV
ncbi:MAG: ATP-binding protein, partial [Chitinophagaceae bacterium]|nr:ATP-binding protein [Chitinophagaceae bacterium]